MNNDPLELKIPDNPDKRFNFLMEMIFKGMVFGTTYTMLEDTINHWKEEVNTNRESFDYNSQDCYRQAYNNISISKLVKEYPSDNFQEEGKSYYKRIFDAATQLIKLYQKHVDLFLSYDREGLMFKEFRTINPEYKEVSDEQLRIDLYQLIELPQRDLYYKSKFYEEFGFLLNDYHTQIYLLCKHIVTTIKNNFKDEKLFQTIEQTESLAPYFSYCMLEELYNYVNGKQFVKMYPNEFINAINLTNYSSKFKIHDSETRRVQYLIYRLALLIDDKQKSKYWELTILNRLKMEQNDYIRHRKEAGQEGEINKDFSKEIDRILLIGTQK